MVNEKRPIRNTLKNIGLVFFLTGGIIFLVYGIILVTTRFFFHPIGWASITLGWVMSVFAVFMLWIKRTF